MKTFAIWGWLFLSAAITYAADNKSDNLLNTGDAAYAKSLYMLHCQGCHLANGEGFAARGVPVLKDYMGYFLEVEGGRDYLAQVPGAAFSPLDDHDLSLVMNWMLQTFSPEQLADDYQPYTEEEISNLRKFRTQKDVTIWREELVKLIEEAGLIETN